MILRLKKMTKDGGMIVLERTLKECTEDEIMLGTDMEARLR